MHKLIRWSTLLKQMKRLVCCEKYVQNVTNFLSPTIKPVKRLNAEISYNFIFFNTLERTGKRDFALMLDVGFRPLTP